MILYHKDKVITFNTINYMLKINPPNKTTNDFTTISITSLIFDIPKKNVTNASNTVEE